MKKHRFIVSRAPKEYLKQGLSLCGAYSVKAILSAYGKDDKANPADYIPNIFFRYIRKPTMHIWPKVFESYGITAKIGNTKHLSEVQRIQLLKNLIDQDTPVMLRIGNGYLSIGRYNNFIASFIGHWITLWGYNDKEKAFYVYDSCVPTERHDKTIPIGNTKRTYIEILRDWGKGFPFRWRHSYITINNKFKLK